MHIEANRVQNHTCALTQTHPHPPTHTHTHTPAPPHYNLKIHGVFEDANQTINPTGALCAAPTEFNVTTLLQTAGGYISENNTATEHGALPLNKNVK